MHRETPTWDEDDRFDAGSTTALGSDLHAVCATSQTPPAPV